MLMYTLLGHRMFLLDYFLSDCQLLNADGTFYHTAVYLTLWYFLMDWGTIHDVWHFMLVCGMFRAQNTFYLALLVQFAGIFVHI